MEGIARSPVRLERRSSASRALLLARVRAEFREMPCLRLTSGQAQRFFGMRVDVCERVFAALVEEGTLACGPDARYGLPLGMVWRAHILKAS